MSSIVDHELWSVFRGDMFWMLGNTALAWAGVLFLWCTTQFATRPRIASTIVVACATVLPTIRLLRADSSPDMARIAVMAAASLALGAAAAFWAYRAARGTRWALWLAVFGAIAFAPNAPYVLTDGMHFVQDVRRIDLALFPSWVLAVVYGWFLAIALTAWIVLVRIARQFVPARRRLPALVLLSAIMAAGIYIGRIVRVNSWQLVTRPDQVLLALADIVTERGPAIFTLVWTAVVLVTSIVGVASVEHAKRTQLQPRGRRLVAGWAWLLAGAWLIGMPLIRVLDPHFGVASTRLAPMTVVGALLIGGVLVVLGLQRMGYVAHGEPRALVHVPPEQPRTVARWRIAAVAIGALALLGPVLVIGSTVGWWAQYRSLCHYGPAHWMHEERCVDDS